MIWIAKNPELYIGRVVGNGHCIAFVRHVTGLPPTAQWRRGNHVRSKPPPVGTAIATFGPNGLYENRTDGSSHAAILVAVPSADGLRCTDQWRGQPVHERTIHFREGVGPKVNDGCQYYAIILDPPPLAA